jgi:hypothetical protein
MSASSTARSTAPRQKWCPTTTFVLPVVADRLKRTAQVIVGPSDDVVKATAKAAEVALVVGKDATVGRKVLTG